jgi:hypothetical protein
MILFLSDPKGSPKKPVRSDKHFKWRTGYKINT